MTHRPGPTLAEPQRRFEPNYVDITAQTVATQRHSPSARMFAAGQIAFAAAITTTPVISAIVLERVVNT